MNINVLILEDNPLTSQDLKEIIEEQGMMVTGIAKNREEAMKSIKEQKPDVLLVDIFLKGGDDGINIVNELERAFPIIFLTANSDRETVDRALKTRPASFLTKPYDDQDVIIALELAFNNHYNTVLDSENQKMDFVFLKAGNKFEKVFTEDILYLQADGSYTRFVTPTKEFTLSGNLNNTSEKIRNPAFLRIHRSYIVNIKSVTGIDKDSVFIEERSLPISRSYREEVSKQLMKIS